MKQIGKIAFAIAAAVIASTTWAKTYTLTVKSTNTSRGTVSGSGKYAAGKKLTIKATAKSGYVFAGWFSDKACTERGNLAIYNGNYLDPKVKVKVNKNTTIYAKFISKAADKKALGLSGLKKYKSSAYVATAGQSFGALTTEASFASRSTLTFKNLPKGLELLGNEAIEGTPTVPGKYTVTATLTSAAGNKVTQKFKIYIKAPSWARGEFSGVAEVADNEDWDAYTNFSVDKYGNVDGYILYKNTQYTFNTAYTSCTGEMAKFKPVVKIGSKTIKFAQCKVMEHPVGGEDVRVTDADTDADSRNLFAQTSANLFGSGRPLADLAGKTLTFTRENENSGLIKEKDKLNVTFKSVANKYDFLDVTGTVNGKELNFSELIPLFFLNIKDDGSYDIYAFIIDQAAKYNRAIIFTVNADGVTTQFIP